MKFFYVLCFIFFPSLLSATHFIGYDVEHIINADSTVFFRIKLYRDCNGTGSINNELSLRIQGSNVRNCFRDATINKLPQTRFINNICNSEQMTSCINNAIEEITYEGTIDLLNCDTDFSVMFSSCCRSGSITNIENPMNTVMVAYTTFSLGYENISPLYNNNTVVHYCAGLPSTYTHGIVETEGDSLAFELIPSTRDLSNNVLYLSGFSAINPLANTDFSFNTQTGEINFTPIAGLAQKIIITVKIKEYRNGQLISTQTRELCFIISATCNNILPTFSNIQYNANALPQNRIINYCPNENITISFTVTDANTTQILSLNTYFNQLFPNAQVSIIGTNPINYSLLIPSADLAQGAYILDFIAKDNNCPIVGFSSLSLFLKPIEHILEFNSLDTLCINNTTTISLQNTYANYLWSTGETTASIQTNTTINNYTVSVTDINNCHYVDSININYYDAIDFNIVSNNVNCNTNGSIHVTSSTSNITYTLNNQVPQNNGLFENLLLGTYSIKLTDENACFVDTNVVINNAQMSSITPIAYDTLLCEGAQTTLGLVENFATYAWSTGATTAVINTIANTSNYTVTTTDNNGCIYTQNFNIVQSSLIDFTAILVHNPCPNNAIGEIRLLHIPAAILYDYVISSGAPAISYGHFNNLTSGNYTITATDIHGCSRVENYTINTLSVLELLAITNDTIIEEGSSVLLTSIINSNANINTENWTLPAHISNANYQNGSDVIIAPTQSDIYRFYAENEYGCRIDTSISIQVNPRIIIEDSTYIIKFPNAFTPNGDGENDTFKPIGIPAEFVKEFKVYNRWGNLVFDGDLSTGGWDGTYKNEAQPRDVYIALIKYSLPNIEEENARIEFILMR